MKHVQAWQPVASTIQSAVYAMFFVKNRFTKLPEYPPNLLESITLPKIPIITIAKVSGSAGNLFQSLTIEHTTKGQ